MQLCNLIDAVVEEIGPYGQLADTSTAAIIKLLNEGQEEIARELDIPRLYLETDDADRVIPLPEGMRSNGVLWLEDDRNRRYRIFTISEANQLYPAWESQEYGGVAVYNAAHMPRARNPLLYVLPWGPGVGYYRLEVAMRPMYMTRMADSPFKVDEDFPDVLEEYHIGVAYYAIWRLLARLTDEVSISKSLMFHNAYKSLKDSMLSESMAHYIFPRRRLYREGVWA